MVVMLKHVLLTSPRTRGVCTPIYQKYTGIRSKFWQTINSAQHPIPLICSPHGICKVNGIGVMGFLVHLVLPFQDIPISEAIISPVSCNPPGGWIICFYIAHLDVLPPSMTPIGMVLPGAGSTPVHLSKVHRRWDFGSD